MIRVVRWHEVPRPVRQVAFALAVGCAVVVVLGLAALFLAALALRVAERGGL